MSSGGTLLGFPNRSDAQEFKHVLVCAMHFSNHVIKRGAILIYRENKALSFDRFTFSNVSDGALESIKLQRKPPKVRIYQEDQLESFKKPDSIKIKFG